MKKILISLVILLMVISAFSIAFATEDTRAQQALAKVGEMFSSGELLPTFMFLLATIVLIIVAINKQSIEPKVANITIVVCIVVIFVDVFFYGYDIKEFLNQLLNSEKSYFNNGF